MRGASLAAPEAFETAAMVRATARFVKRIMRESQSRGELTLATKHLFEIIEPLDLMVISTLYVIACKNGVAARLTRFVGRVVSKRRRAARRRKAVATDDEDEAAEAVAEQTSLRRAVGEPLRLLFCGILPFFYVVDVISHVLSVLTVPLPRYTGVAVR